LNADPAKRLKQGYGAKDIAKSMRIRVQKEPSSLTFSACYAVMLTGKTTVNGMASNETGNDISKTLCMQMNTDVTKPAFTWDEQLSICKPNSVCATGTVFTGIDSTGSVKCRTIESWTDMNELIDSTAPATCPPGYKVKFSTVYVSGLTKVRVTCFP
jgi:hypothetical protein